MAALARTIAILVTGLLASGIFCGLIASRFLSSIYDPQGVPGFLGGMLAFTCVRLWLAAPRKNSN
jgi:hypothetical protein